MSTLLDLDSYRHELYEQRQQQQQQQQQQQPGQQPALSVSPTYSILSLESSSTGPYGSTNSPSSSSGASNMSPQSSASELGSAFNMQGLQLSPASVASTSYQQQPLQYGTTTDYVYTGPPIVPHLQILEQPVDKFRFRYISEMHGTHGSLMGARTEKNKKTFPAVELRGYRGDAKIRCSLYQVDPARRAPHSHNLVIKSGDIDLSDPHDIAVGPDGGGYVATFQGMGIIHTAKKNIAEELFKKLRRHRATELNREPTEREEQQMQKEASVMARTMNLNQVCLCYQAFRVEATSGQWVPICDPVYTNAINNMKSALTGELKICRLSTAVSGVDGGEEVFMFVEKVCKNNIQIRFYELNEYDQEVWEGRAVFSEADVHHQYAIAFRTPPYRCKDITETVEVYMQLYRPRDGCQSEPVPFKYKPRPGAVATGSSGSSTSRKRFRVSSANVSSDIPTVLPHETAQLPPLHQPFPMIANHGQPSSGAGEPANTISKELSKAAIIQDILGLQTTGTADVLFDSSDFMCNSEEFNKLMQDIGGQQDLRMLETDAVPVSSTAETDDGLPKAVDRYLQQRTGEDARPGDALKKVLLITQLFANDADRGRNLLSSHWRSASSQQSDCLHLAIERGEETIGCMLVDLLVAFALTDLLELANERNETALHLAIGRHCYAVVGRLLSAGASPARCDGRGNSALHRAVAECAPEAVGQLLAAPGIVSGHHRLLEATNDEGCTPLHVAVQRRSLRITRMLLDAGASPHRKDLRHGNNVLHVAVESDSLDIVNHVLERVGPGLGTVPNSAGYTALHLAYARQQANASNKLIVRELLRHMPDVPERVEPADDEDDEPEDDHDEDEEDDDDDGGADVLLQSIQHSREQRKDVVRLLEEHRVVPSPSPPAVAKSPGGPPKRRTILFDDRCRAELGQQTLATDNRWRKVASLLEYGPLLEIWEQSPEPARMLLDYIEVQGLPLEQLIGILQALELSDAIRCIDEMVCRQMT